MTALPDLSPLVRLLPQRVQDKAKSVVAGLAVLPSTVLFLFPALGGNQAWTVGVAAFTALAGGFGVYLTPNLLPYTATDKQ